MQLELTEHNLIEQMLLAFPELEPEYAELVRGDAPDTPHNYAATAIMGRYFCREADRGEISVLLRQCAEFFERAATSSDHEAVNIIWIEIFEPLIFNPTHLKVVWPILGPKSKSIFAMQRNAGRRQCSFSILMRRTCPSSIFLINERVAGA